MKLYDKLVDYSKTNIYPMHMPGHKRNEKVMDMINPYSIDITEVEGFDNLFHADDILKACMERAASLYKSQYCNYLIGGSSAGILSGISACTKKGDKVLLTRDCHKSVYNAIYINELKPIYIYPQINNEYGINCGTCPKSIKEMLKEYKDIKLIIITSPTYEGVVSDINRISQIAHEHNIPLLVDEAHGAHLGFNNYFPPNSISLGADITIHSLHKTLPSFTQTGLIHVKSNLVDYEKVKYYLSIYQSTSPSYILMSSIDKCINLLLEEKEDLFYSYSNRLIKFYKRMGKLKSLKVIFKENKDFYMFDPSKIVVSTRNTNLSGKDLYDILLEDYKIQVEMSSTDYIIAMTSICDTDEGFKRLADALLEIDNETSNSKIIKNPNISSDKTNKATYKPQLYSKLTRETKIDRSSYEAINSKLESIPFSKSAGRVVGEYIYLYPPGIPVLVPGEVISENHIIYLQKCKELGLSVQGPEDYNLNYIKVTV